MACPAHSLSVDTQANMLACAELRGPMLGKSALSGFVNAYSPINPLNYICKA